MGGGRESKVGVMGVGFGVVGGRVGDESEGEGSLGLGADEPDEQNESDKCWYMGNAMSPLVYKRVTAYPASPIVVHSRDRPHTRYWHKRSPLPSHSHYIPPFHH